MVDMEDSEDTEVLEDLDTVDGIHSGAIVLDGQVIMADLAGLVDSVGLDTIHSGLVHLDMTLSGVVDLVDSAVDLDTILSGVVDSEGLAVMADLEDGADGTLITQDTGTLTDQFIMVAG